ncbi:hypothetical protein D3C76_1422580 [compost metagenome]
MDVRASTVYLLVNTDFTQHTVGQFTFDWHYNSWLTNTDQTHRSRGANQKVLFIKSQAAVPVGMH